MNRGNEDLVVNMDTIEKDNATGSCIYTNGISPNYENVFIRLL